MTRDVSDVTRRKRGLRSEKSQLVELSWILASEEDGWLSELAEALRRVPRVVVVGVGADGKIIIESFVPELRSRVFRVSGFLCYLYIWLMNILCTFHTSVYYVAMLQLAFDLFMCVFFLLL